MLCMFSRSVIGFFAKLADVILGVTFVLGCCMYFIPFSFSPFFISPLNVERGLGFLLLLIVDLAA